MCVAIVIPENWSPAKLVLWSAAIARAKNENLVVFRPKRSANRGKRRRGAAAASCQDAALAAAIRKHAREFMSRDLDCQSPREAVKAIRRADSSARCVFVRRLERDDFVSGVLNELKPLRVKTLIIPRHKGVRFGADEFAAERQLLAEACCETLQLRPGEAGNDSFHSILVASEGPKAATPALSFGAKLAANRPVDVTSVVVEPEAHPPARSKGHAVVERLVRSSKNQCPKNVTSEVVVDKDVPKGLRTYATAKGHDLIVIGGDHQSTADAPARASVSEKLLSELDDRTVVVLRNTVPLTVRLWRLTERFKNRFVPQLERQSRLELVHRLHDSAKWDFDFIFLISVATMLAALGLSLNSPPVVIGAMLVAPLMTPMLGVGLSVVQGNKFMATDCFATIRRGFLAAFLIGCAVGLVRFCFTTNVTHEMSNRGSPGILDLLVAFVSGAVAAYAFGRPHLLSVVPGIAIATSLVPPVATAGLSLSTREWNLALGATLLFVSNFVAIVLGSATCLWFVGMRGPRRFSPFATWARRSIAGLTLAALCLALWSFGKKSSSPGGAAPLVAQGDQPTESPPVAGKEPRDADDSEQVIADEEDAASAERLVEQELDRVEVVLEPRARVGREATVADVTLRVPNRRRLVELEGIVAQRRAPGRVVLDLPDWKSWARQKRPLSARQKEGLESPGFYDLLEKHIARRLETELNEPVL